MENSICITVPELGENTVLFLIKNVIINKLFGRYCEANLTFHLYFKNKALDIYLGFPMRNSAIIAQNLHCSWLTYLYKFKIHLGTYYNKKSYWWNKKLFSSVFVVLDIRRIIHILRIIALKLTACIAIAVHFLNS